MQRCIDIISIVTTKGTISKVVSMKLKRVLSIGSHSDNHLGGASRLTPRQRLSLLEDLRRDAARIFHYEYPKRLRRVLTVVERKKG
jgi:hypothetical protein